MGSSSSELRDGFLKVQFDMLCCLGEEIFVAGSEGLETTNSACTWRWLSQLQKWLWLCSACLFVFHAGVTGYFAGEEEWWPCFSKTRMTNGVLSPWDCSPCILSPLGQGGRCLMAEGFGSTASSFLFVGLPWQQEAGSRLQRKGSLEGNKSRNQGGEMPSLHMSCVFQPAGTIIWTTRAQRPS